MKMSNNYSTSIVNLSEQSHKEVLAVLETVLKEREQYLPETEAVEAVAELRAEMTKFYSAIACGSVHDISKTHNSLLLATLNAVWAVEGLKIATDG